MEMPGSLGKLTHDYHDAKASVQDISDVRTVAPPEERETPLILPKQGVGLLDVRKTAKKVGISRQDKKM